MSPTSPRQGFIQGINLNGERHTEPFSVYKDFSKRGGFWQIFDGSIQPTGGTTLPYLPNGFPDYSQAPWSPGDQACLQLVISDSLGDWPDGTYTIIHTGGYARLLRNADTGGSAMAAGAYTHLSPTKTTQDVQHANGDSIVLLLENQDPITEVKVFPPGFDPDTDPEPSKPANPTICGLVKLYISNGGYLRFTEGMYKYGESTTHWGDPDGLTVHGWLPLPEGQWDVNSGNHKPLWHFSQFREPGGGQAGMSLSLMCDIADEVGANPWICTCPGYDNQQLDHTLEYLWTRYAGTGRKVRIGYGLEPWNSGFPTYQYIKYTSGSAGNPYDVIWYQFFANDLARFMDRIDQVDPDRLVFEFTFDGNAASTSFIKQTFLSGGLARMPEVMTVAAYFGPTSQQITAWRSVPPVDVDEIITASYYGLGIKLAAMEANYNEIAARAAALSVPMPIVSTYEGGYSLIPGVTSYLGLMHDAYQHSAQTDFYNQMRDKLIAVGFDEVTWYKLPTSQSTKDGEWGHGRAFITEPYWSEIRGAVVRGFVTTPAGDPDPTQSSAVAVPATNVPADGVTISTVTITVRDAAGYPLAGLEVQIAVSGTGNIVTQPAEITDVFGQTTGTVASTVAETKVVTVTVDPAGTPVVLDDHPTIGFVEVEPPPPPPGEPRFVLHKVSLL